MTRNTFSQILISWDLQLFCQSAWDGMGYTAGTGVVSPLMNCHCSMAHHYYSSEFGQKQWWVPNKERVLEIASTPHKGAGF